MTAPESPPPQRAMWIRAVFVLAYTGSASAIAAGFMVALLPVTGPARLWIWCGLTAAFTAVYIGGLGLSIRRISRR